MRSKPSISKMERFYGGLLLYSSCGSGAILRPKKIVFNPNLGPNVRACNKDPKHSVTSETVILFVITLKFSKWLAYAKALTKNNNILQ